MIATHAMRWPVAVALVATVAAGAWLLRTFDPNAAGSIFPPCLFLSFTGLYCPGCGLTRMLHALVHFDIARAAGMNALLLAMLPLGGAIALNEAGGRRLIGPALARPLYNGWLWIGALLLFGLLRNLPWAPFTALAPG